jgi:hypothetical protein
MAGRDPARLVSAALLLSLAVSVGGAGAHPTKWLLTRGQTTRAPKLPDSAAGCVGRDPAPLASCGTGYHHIPCTSTTGSVVVFHLNVNRRVIATGTGTNSSSSAVAPDEIVLLVLVLVVLPIPAFVVGRRRRVKSPGIAFVPYVGAWIVILRSIGRSGWLAVLAVIPLVSWIFGIWAAFTVPSEHERTRWWALPFLIPGVNLVAFWVYAITLEPTPAAPAAA